MFARSADLADAALARASLSQLWLFAGPPISTLAYFNSSGMPDLRQDILVRFDAETSRLKQPPDRKGAPTRRKNPTCARPLVNGGKGESVRA
jgi:hypothetical protein